MKIQVMKMAGGILAPATELDAEQLKKFKNNEAYEIEIKRHRNPAFHRKVFLFFHFCFAHWDADLTDAEHLSEAAQFERFRKDLIILAGYYHTTIRLNGETRLEAKSLAYGSMDPDEFEECYKALINAALKFVFHKMDDDEIYQQLASFF